MAEPKPGQSDFGVDVTLIEERMALTPTQRWEQHARVLAFVEDLRSAARAQRSPQDPAMPSR